MEDLLRPISLNLSQYNVLKNLEASSPATGAELSRKAFVTPQTMHTILTTMERKEFITRTAITGNTKSFNIFITDRGSAALENADETLSKLFDRANATLTLSEYDELERLLRKLSLGLKVSNPI